MDHLLFIQARCERAEVLRVTEDARHRRWLHKPIFLSIVREVSQLSVWDQNICRHPPCLSSGVSIKLVMLSCCTWSSPLGPPGFQVQFKPLDSRNIKQTETVSFSFLQAVVWRLRPMIFYSLASCCVEKGQRPKGTGAGLYKSCNF